MIYLNTYSEEGQQVFEAAQAAGYPPFTLVAISDLDWEPRHGPVGQSGGVQEGDALYRRSGRLPAAAGG